MDFFKSRYCTLSRTLLSCVGLWPYQCAWLSFTIRTVITFFLVTLICAQIAPVLKMAIDVEYLIDIAPMVALPVGGAVMITERYINMDKMQIVFEEIQKCWKNIVVEEEIEIMRKHSDIGRRLSFVYSLYVLSAVMLYDIATVSPFILDIIWPLNESRPHRRLCKFELFIDVEEHYFIVLIYFIALINVSLLIILGHQVVLTVFIYHLCGLFGILWHRVEHASGIGKNGNINKLKGESIESEFVIYRRFVNCARTHLYATKLSSIVDKSSNCYIFLILLGCFVLITLDLVQGTTLSSTRDEFERYDRVYKSTVIICGGLLNLLFNGYMGQTLMDMSLHTFDTVYNVEWYGKNIQIQKLVLLMMVRSLRPSFISAYRIYVLSLQTVSSTLQTSISFFMIIRQVTFT